MSITSKKEIHIARVNPLTVKNQLKKKALLQALDALTAIVHTILKVEQKFSKRLSQYPSRFPRTAL